MAMVSERSRPISARDALTIARIVRVNHAGEYGAIRIYSAQIGVSARRYPDVVPALTDMLQHEKKHCAAFLAALPCTVALELGRLGPGPHNRPDGTRNDLDLHGCGRSRRAPSPRRSAGLP